MGSEIAVADRDRRTKLRAISVGKLMMAAADPPQDEAGSFEGADDRFRSDGRQLPAHAGASVTFTVSTIGIAAASSLCGMGRPSS
jgi:hypothetical protein